MPGSRNKISKSPTKDAKDTPLPSGCTPDRAMVLAAGLGLRMHPITKLLPKALVKTADRTLLDWSLDRLEEEGIKKAVLNLHYLGHLIEQHLGSRPSPEFLFSKEDELLDTGGGVLKALPMLGSTPFFVVNSDSLWLNSNESALARMTAAWDDERMDGLLLMHSTVEAYGYQGMGDFLIDPNGLISHRPESELSPYVFTGVQLLHPRLFEGLREDAFSLNILYDRAIENGRLYAIVHDGEWFHIGTPEGLAEAEAFMHQRYSGIKHR